MSRQSAAKGEHIMTSNKMNARIYAASAVGFTGLAIAWLPMMRAGTMLVPGLNIAVNALMAVTCVAGAVYEWRKSSRATPPSDEALAA
jgi:hypothetical protein